MCLDYFTKGNNKHILFYSLTVYYVRPGNKQVFYLACVLGILYSQCCVFYYPLIQTYFFYEIV